MLPRFVILNVAPERRFLYANLEREVKDPDNVYITMRLQTLSRDILNLPGLQLDSLRQLFFSFFDRRSAHQELSAPAFRQVHPTGILALHQSDLSRTLPSLQLLFTAYGALHPIIALVVDQPGTVIALREPLDFAGFVLPDSYIKIIGHPYVERAGSADHDVDPVFVFVRHSCEALFIGS